MIKVCDGNIEIKGHKVEIMADVSTIVDALVIEGKVLSEDELSECVEVGLLSEDEVHERAKKAAESISNNFERLGEILGNIIRRGME